MTGGVLVGVVALRGSLPLPLLALVFAVLRRVVGVKEGQVKLWEKDING